VEGHEVDILVQGFPGKSVCHGGLGWSTIALIRGAGRTVLIDTGSFNMRRLIVAQLAERGLTPADVTDVILTHSHYDHSINWITFPNARVVIGNEELAWAAVQPVGHTLVPELYIRELTASPQLAVVKDGEEAVPGITAHLGPGHTPGCMMFHLHAPDRDVIFTGDAVKNRAEFLSGETDMTMDAAASRATVENAWAMWRARPGTIVVPGHDVPMVLENGRPTYIEGRRAGITAWFGDTLDSTTLFELTADAPVLRRQAAE
jgi:glyoxylase-like metal-dependent hydrolase (beta-lactamase superfamily II)